MPRSPRFAALGALALVLLVACGRSPDEESSASAATTSTVPPVPPATTTTAPAATTTASPATTEVAGTDAADTGGLEKPEVKLPDETPTELVVTDLTEGTGDPAKDGDTVVVHYVGVRTEDGVEFDNSYDGGRPFPVMLGEGGVIAGWDEGLVGVMVGGRRQLDIPAELAYGEDGAGEVIRPGDALSFVIDVVAVIGSSDPADKPDISVAPAKNVQELTTEDLVLGDGPEIEVGQTAVVQLIAIRADTGEEIYSTWASGAPESLVFDETQLLPGLFQGLDGMKIGGRRSITIPYEESFGSEGSEGLGLPAEVDLVVILDLLSVY